jgi:hypothetical protein
MITVIHQKSIKQIRIIKLTNLEQIKNMETLKNIEGLRKLQKELTWTNSQRCSQFPIQYPTWWSVTTSCWPAFIRVRGADLLFSSSIFLFFLLYARLRSFLFFLFQETCSLLPPDALGGGIGLRKKLTTLSQIQVCLFISWHTVGPSKIPSTKFVTDSKSTHWFSHDVGLSLCLQPRRTHLHPLLPCSTSSSPRARTKNPTFGSSAPSRRRLPLGRRRPMQGAQPSPEATAA